MTRCATFVFFADLALWLAWAMRLEQPQPHHPTDLTPDWLEVGFGFESVSVNADLRLRETVVQTQSAV